MDRYVIRERRVGNEYPEGNHMIAFSASSTGNNITIPENVYYGPYSNETLNTNMHYSPGLVPLPPQGYLPNMMHGQAQTQLVSGIDPRYLAAYSDSNAGYIATGRALVESKPIAVNAFGSNYQNRNFIGAERTENKRCVPQRIPNVTEGINVNNTSIHMVSTPQPPTPYFKPTEIEKQKHTPATYSEETSNKQGEIDLSKTGVQYQVKTRAEKLKELHKSGIRVFSGPVENVLKWHKSLQDIGILILYEIVGKCVSIRAGDNCAKNLVVRDDNGPAIQVVYYEVDYLLPELVTPCVIRVVGRIQPRTSRLHAFAVRAATGDDVATLPRRTAIASHHVAKLCNDYK